MGTKGKRLASSSNGKTIKKDWAFESEVDITLPGGFALDAQLTCPIVEYQYTYSAVITFDDGNFKENRGTMVCSVEVPEYTIEYNLI